MNMLMATIKQRLFLVVAAVLTVGMIAGLAARPDAKAAAQASGGTSYFLKIDGIDGESTDARHANEIELTSFAWAKDGPGLQNPTTSSGGGGGAGKVQVHDIHFTQLVSKASPQLMKSCASGKHFKKAMLSVERRGGKNQQKYMTIELTDVVVSSYRVAGQDDSTPRDEFTLSFSGVAFSYFPQNKDGSTGAPIVGTIDDGREEL